MAKYKKFDFIVGARAEDYDISGTTLILDDNKNWVNTPLTPFKNSKYSQMQVFSITLSHQFTLI